MANTTLGQTVKEQIGVALQTLQTNVVIKSIEVLDTSPNPFDVKPKQGYPLAIVAMPKVTSDFEDNDTNLRTYTFDVLFVINPSDLDNKMTGVETIIDAVLDEFDNVLTLKGAAAGAVLPTEINSFPVSTPDRTLLCFVATIRARTLYGVTLS